MKILTAITITNCNYYGACGAGSVTNEKFLNLIIKVLQKIKFLQILQRRQRWYVLQSILRPCSVKLTKKLKIITR